MKTDINQKSEVHIIKSERGFGSKIDEIKYFENDIVAKTFCEKYNKKHCPTRDKVPDWYTFAKFIN